MAAWLAGPSSFVVMLALVVFQRQLRFLLPTDSPAGRKQHQGEVPMAGMLLAAWTALFLGTSPWLLAGTVLLALIGFVDDRGKKDRKGLPWQWKLLAICCAACAAVVELDQAHGLLAGQWILAFGLLLVTINAVNFLDNTDGVSAALGGMGLLLATGGEGPLAWVGFVYLGFLPLNWPRAALFLGDSGALVLGYCLCLAAMQAGLAGGQGNLLSWATFGPLLIFHLDFIQVVAARLVIGVPPWVGDRRHLTHVSMNCGLPRVLVAPVFAGLGWTFYWGLGRALG